MDDVTAGRAIRVVRRRLGLTQEQLAAACGLSQGAVSRAERGHIDTLSLRTIRAIATRLEMRAEILLRWRGGELDRLLSRRHSALHEEVARMFATLSDWEPHPEVTFSIWGERGWVDVLAWHPSRRILLVIELKTDIVDIQDLIGRVDMKVRLAPEIAKRAGFDWTPTVVAAWVVVSPGRTNERRLATHATVLRTAFPADGRAIRRWLRDPSGSIRALSFPPSSTPGSARRGSAGGATSRRPSSRSMKRAIPAR
jgi:transcriptional regulator with XRE-family HTH domain